MRLSERGYREISPSWVIDGSEMHFGERIVELSMSDAAPWTPSYSIRQGRGWYIPVAFAGLIVATYLLGVVLGTLSHGEPTLLPVVFEPILFPILFVVMPPVLAVVNMLRGGSVPISLAIGLVPGLIFPVLGLIAMLLGLGNGDTPAWALSLVFGAIGLLGALAGTGVAVASIYAYRTWIE